MMFANATNIYRKSGVAEWRDLRFLFPVFNSNPMLPGTCTISSV